MNLTLAKLPIEVLVNITSYLDPHDIFSLSLTSKTANSIFLCDEVWFNQVSLSKDLRSHNWRSFHSFEEVHKFTKHKRSYFDFCRMKFIREKEIKCLINDIILVDQRVENVEKEQSIQKRLFQIYREWDSYVPFILKERMHLSNKSGLSRERHISVKEFQSHLLERSAQMPKISIASSLEEIGRMKLWLEFYRHMMLCSDEEISSMNYEEVMLGASLLDPEFFEFLHFRDSFINNTLEKFDKKIINENQNVTVEIKMLTLIKALDLQLQENSIHRQPQTEYAECRSIVRAYSGNCEPTSFLYLTILQSLCQLVGIKTELSETFISFESVDLETNKSITNFIIKTSNGVLHFKNKIPPNLGSYPIDAYKYRILQRNKINIDPRSALYKRLIFTNIFQNLFSGLKSNFVDYFTEDELTNSINSQLMSTQSFGSCIDVSYAPFLLSLSISMRKNLLVSNYPSHIPKFKQISDLVSYSLKDAQLLKDLESDTSKYPGYLLHSLPLIINEIPELVELLTVIKPSNYYDKHFFMPTPPQPPYRPLYGLKNSLVLQFQRHIPYLLPFLQLKNADGVIKVGQLVTINKNSTATAAVVLGFKGQLNNSVKDAIGSNSKLKVMNEKELLTLVDEVYAMVFIGKGETNIALVRLEDLLPFNNDVHRETFRLLSFDCMGEWFCNFNWESNHFTPKTLWYQS